MGAGRTGCERAIGGRQLSQAADATEEIQDFQAGPAVICVASERSGPDAADRRLHEFRPVERIDPAKRYRAAIVARAILDRAQRTPTVPNERTCGTAESRIDQQGIVDMRRPKT